LLSDGSKGAKVACRARVEYIILAAVKNQRLYI